MVAEGQELVVYTKGILSVLQMLNECKTSNFTPQLLQYLYQFILKFLRRFQACKWLKLEPAFVLQLQQAIEQSQSPEVIRDFRVPLGILPTLLEGGIDLSNRRMEFRLVDEYFDLMDPY